MQPSLQSTKPAALHGAWTPVILLWFAFALNYIDRQLAYSIFPALRQELGFTQVQLGLVGTVFLWTYGASMIFTGKAADRFNRRRLILASVVLWSAATAASGLSNSPIMFLIWRSVVGISEALYFPAAMGILASLHTGPTRSTALALHQSAQLAGIVAGGWYGGWAADHIGWRQGFLAVAAAGILYAAVLALVLRTSGGHESPRTVNTSAIGELLRSRCFVTLLFAFCAFCAMLWIFYAWLPNFLYERHGLSMEQSGLIATAYLQVSSAIGLLGGGVMADRLAARIPGARFYVGSAGLLLSPVFCFGVFSAGTLTGLIAYLIGFGVTAGLMQSAVFAAAYDVSSPRNYGLAAGTLNVSGSLGGGASVLAVGQWQGLGGIQDLSRYAGALTAISGAALVAVAASAFVRERHSRPQV